MLKMRKKLAEYSEIYFLIYIMIVGGMRATGRGTFDIVWLSGIAFLCLGIKLAVTDYSKKEIFWMLAFGCLVVFNFLINHEKTLFLTMISIYGAKNVNLNRVFFYSLWSKVILFAGQVLLAFTGLIDGGYGESMPKYFILQRRWGIYNIPKLGFTHPNYTYLSVIMIALLLVLVYRERLKWYMWIGLSAVLFLFYRILLCRTGWYIWLFTLAVVGCYKLSVKLKIKEVYIKLLCIIPPFLAIFGIIIVIMMSKGNAFAAWLNVCFTGRISMAVECLPSLFRLFANPVRTANEIAYIQLPYNYGWILYLFSLIVYIKTMWMMAKRKEDYYVIIFAVISVYFLGEAVPVSSGWNTSLLLVSGLIFERAEENNVSTGIIN